MAAAMIAAVTDAFENAQKSVAHHPKALSVLRESFATKGFADVFLQMASGIGSVCVCVCMWESTKSDAPLSL
jgi:hypothetical protein